MARTEKNTVGYFPHDSDASNSDTLTVIQSQFGNNGYAVWFKLLERLAASDGHFVDISDPQRWKLLVARLGTDEITTVEILKLLVVTKAIDPDLYQSGVIWCQKLVDNVADVYKNRRREKPQKPITTDINPITTVDIKSIEPNTEITTTNLHCAIPPHENEAKQDCPPSPTPPTPLPPQVN